VDLKGTANMKVTRATRNHLITLLSFANLLAACKWVEGIAFFDFLLFFHIKSTKKV